MSLVWAVFVGWIAFGESMGGVGLLGCTVIIAAGVASARLERRERVTWREPALSPTRSREAPCARTVGRERCE